METIPMAMAILTWFILGMMGMNHTSDCLKEVETHYFPNGRPIWYFAMFVVGLTLIGILGPVGLWASDEIGKKL